MFSYLSLFITVAWQLSVIVPRAGPPELSILLLVIDQLCCKERSHKTKRTFFYFFLYFFCAIANGSMALRGRNRMECSQIFLLVLLLGNCL